MQAQQLQGGLQQGQAQVQQQLRHQQQEGHQQRQRQASVKSSLLAHCVSAVKGRCKWGKRHTRLGFMAVCRLKRA